MSVPPRIHPAPRRFSPATWRQEATDTQDINRGVFSMRLSTRNQLTGTVASIDAGSVSGG
jgi:hypothetical protein